MFLLSHKHLAMNTTFSTTSVGYEPPTTPVGNPNWTIISALFIAISIPPTFVLILFITLLSKHSPNIQRFFIALKLFMHSNIITKHANSFLGCLFSCFVLYIKRIVILSISINIFSRVCLSQGII